MSEKQESAEEIVGHGTRYRIEQDGTLWRLCCPGGSSHCFRDSTKAEEMLQQILETPPCVECGEHTGAIDDRWTKDCTQRLRERQLCFGCDFWIRAIETADKHLIADGVVYFDEGRKGPDHPRHWLGFGGRWWEITKEGRTWQTNNLFYCGEIPQRFRSRLPNNCSLQSIEVGGHD